MEQQEIKGSEHAVLRRQYTVIESKLSFVVVGLAQGEYEAEKVPFAKETNEWQQAMSWVEELAEADGCPQLSIIEIMKAEESSLPLQRMIFSGRPAELEEEVNARLDELEELFAQERALNKLLEWLKLPEECQEPKAALALLIERIELAKKAYEDAWTKGYSVRRRLLKYGGIKLGGRLYDTR